MATPYDPLAGRPINPIGCVTTWLGGLFHPPAVGYRPASTPAPEPTPTCESTPTLGTAARIRAADVLRAPVFDVNGDLCDDGTGPIVRLTLVVDDIDTATRVLSALHSGAEVRVSVAAG